MHGRFEGGRTDRGMRSSDDSFKISAIFDIWQEEGDTRIHYIFIGSSSVCDHGNAGGVLPEKCEPFCRIPWDSGDCSFRSGCRAARMEEEYAAQYCGGNGTLYVFDPGRILG